MTSTTLTFVVAVHLVFCSPCDRPRVIESLRGVEVVDIAAGGAHSACITASGELFTWGKGRYGRLGHGDSEDQLKPKLVSDPRRSKRRIHLFIHPGTKRPPGRGVSSASQSSHPSHLPHTDDTWLMFATSVRLVQVDALQGHRVIDVACGSGDAQTLCLTDDDMVWSWGDGDYGKLGRGGSDGCKIPMKVKKFAQRSRLGVSGRRRHINLLPLFVSRTEETTRGFGFLRLFFKDHHLHFL